MGVEDGHSHTALSNVGLPNQANREWPVVNFQSGTLAIISISISFGYLARLDVFRIHGDSDVSGWLTVSDDVPVDVTPHARLPCRQLLWSFFDMLGGFE